MYNWSPQSIGSIGPDKLYLQVVDKFGSKIGHSILLPLHPFDGNLSGLAIDPDGHLVISK